MHLELPPPPRHLISPLEGHRTPTIEDTQRDFSTFGASLQPTASRVREAHSSALESLYSPRSRAAYTNEPDPEELSRSISEVTSTGKLNWKKRIRHFTWAFFTLTMATGGIANVIYNSKSFPFVATYCAINLTVSQ